MTNFWNGIVLILETLMYAGLVVLAVAVVALVEHPARRRLARLLYGWERGCAHGSTVPVEIWTGEVVAVLCVLCSAQLERDYPVRSGLVSPAESGGYGHGRRYF